jgi:glutamate synthase domain-containing protein 1
MAHLGHRRLSIIDLSRAADQPLAKHGLVLVYNGELYNYRALRGELAGRGVRFDTTSDTEVVLEAWRMWGAGALPRFRGMFGEAAQQWAFHSLSRSAWARESYDTKITAGHSHHAALHALTNRWLEVLRHCLRLNAPYDEAIHTANRNRALKPAA